MKNYNRGANSTKEIKRAFLEVPEIMGCNLVKWGGKYDISTEWGLFPTGLSKLYVLSINDWVELAKKAMKYKEIEFIKNN